MSLIAEDLTVQVGEKVLVNQACVQCPPGQVVVLLGPNGAGKSTLLGALAGDAPVIGRVLGRRCSRPNGLAPSAPASVSLAGQALADWDPTQLARRRVVLRQHTHVPFAFSVREVVEFGDTPWQNLPRRADPFWPYRCDVIDYLNAVGLGSLAQRKYPTLSGGEARRVQLARAMFQVRALEPRPPGQPPEPRYMLLDEPLAGLDIAESSRVLGLVSQLRAHHIGVVCVFHDLNAAINVADHIVLMRQGKILAQGPPARCMTRENLVECFQTSMSVTHNDRGVPVIQAVFSA